MLTDNGEDPRWLNIVEVVDGMNEFRLLKEASRLDIWPTKWTNDGAPLKPSTPEEWEEVRQKLIEVMYWED